MNTNEQNYKAPAAKILVVGFEDNVMSPISGSRDGYDYVNLDDDDEE